MKDWQGGSTTQRKAGTGTAGASKNNHPSREELENPAFVRELFNERARKQRAGKSGLQCLALPDEDDIDLEDFLPRGGFYERHLDLK